MDFGSSFGRRIADRGFQVRKVSESVSSVETVLIFWIGSMSPAVELKKLFPRLTKN